MSKDLLEQLSQLPRFESTAASAEGDKIGLYYDKSGEYEPYVIDRDSNELEHLDNENAKPLQSDSVVWDFPRRQILGVVNRDDNDKIIAVGFDSGREVLTTVEGQCQIADVTIDRDRILYSRASSESVDIFEYDRNTGTTTRVTDHRSYVRTGQYGPRDNRIAYTANETDVPGNRDVYVTTRDGSSPTRLSIGEEGSQTSVADWHPDGTQLLIWDDSANKSRCGVYDFDSDSISWFSYPECEESPKSFDPTGRGFLATRVRECSFVPVYYEMSSGESTELSLPSGRVTFPKTREDTFLTDDILLLTHETSAQGPVLLTYDLTDGQTETLIQPNYNGVDGDRFVQCDYVTYESFDGLEIEALVYDSGERPSPVAVQIHGGPYGVDIQSFDPLTQTLALHGYSVFKINYRGSGGRGREFREMLYEEVGQSEQRDIAEGVRWLTEQDWVDEERVVAFGDSYGGYSAYMQMLTFPDLYAAGAAWGGITDLKSLLDETTPRYRQMIQQYFEDPEDRLDELRERSPVSRAENLSAPLCIVHGTNDQTLPVSQARSLRCALEEQGFDEGRDGDFEYYELEGEDHESVYGSNRYRLNQKLIDFFERRIDLE